MRPNTLFKKAIALVLALCFCAHSSGLAQVLPAVNPGVNFGQPPILKYLSVNSANPFNYFNFLLGINPQANENLDQEAKKLINYFFLGLTLPNHALWVNLRPDEPERIASEELAKTDMGRVLLEEDLQLKKDVAKYLHPANTKGKEFWEKLYTAIGKDSAKKMKIATSNRVWIVPDEAVVVETEDGALVASAKLKVLSENEYLKENPQDETQAVMEKLMKEIILPALTEDINNAPAYAPLRQIYHSLILAEWFKRKHKSSASAYALSINQGYTNGLESELPWSKQKIWQEYVNSYQKSEYKLQDTLFGLRRIYWSGGIVIDWTGQGTTAGFSSPGTLGAGGTGSVGATSPLKVMGLDDALKTPSILDKIKADIGGDSTVAVIGGTDSTFRNEMPRAELKLVSVASPMKKNSVSGGQGPGIAAAAGGRIAGKKMPTPEEIFTSLKPKLKYKPAELYLLEDSLPGLIVLEPAFGKVRALNFITAKYEKGEIATGELAFLFAHELAELENSDNTSAFQNIKNTFSGLFKPEKEKIKAVKQKEHEMDWRAVELIENDGHSINDAVSMLKKTPELFNEAEKAGLIKGRIRDRETHPSIDERIRYITDRKKPLVSLADTAAALPSIGQGKIYPLGFLDAWKKINDNIDPVTANKIKFGFDDPRIVTANGIVTMQWLSINNGNMNLPEDDSRWWRGYINITPEYMLDAVRIVIESNAQQPFSFKFLLGMYDDDTGAAITPAPNDSHIVVYANNETELKSFLQNISAHLQWEKLEEVAAYPDGKGVHPANKIFQESKIVSYGQGTKEFRSKTDIGPEKDQSQSTSSPANAAVNYLLFPEASARLKQLSEWAAYGDFIIKNFDAGLVSESFVKKEIGAALPKIKAPGAYARILLDSLKRNLVSLDFVKREIPPLLVNFRQEGMWGSYIDTLKNSLSLGVMSEADAKEEAKVLNGLNQQKKYSPYYNILTELLEAGVIKNKDELDGYLKEAADKTESYANVIFKARQKKIYSDNEAKDAIREALENTVQWKYAHASILIKSFEHNLFPRDYVKNEISAALAGFEDLGQWGSYFNILVKARKNNLVDLGFAKEKSAVALKNIKDKDDFGLQVEPFFEAFDNGLLSQGRAYEEINVFLGGFKQRGLLSAYASTLGKALEKGVIGIDKGYLDKQKVFAERNNLSLSYIMKMRQLQSMADIPEGLIESYIEEAKNIFYRANEINNTEEEGSRQIDIKELAYYLNTGLANLQFISENIARQLMSNGLERGYLPLFAAHLGIFSKVDLEYALGLNKFMAATGNKFINKPLFIQQLAGFAVAYKELGLNIEDYNSDLALELDESAIIGRLGKRLTRQIVSRFNIKVDINKLEKAIAEWGDDSDDSKNNSKWDFSDLGILISAKEQWEAQDAEFFNLIFSLTLEGNFGSLIYSSDYSRLDISKFDGPTQELIKKIREYNQNFLSEAKRMNVDVDGWVNPQNVLKPRVIQEGAAQRTAVDILKDFRERFGQFKQLLNTRKDLDKNNQIEQAERSLGPWGRVIDSGVVLDSVKGVISEEVSNGESRLRRLGSLIAGIKKDLGQENIPRQAVDLENTINEIVAFQPQEKGFSGKLGDGYQIGFWQRAPNKDLFLANKAQTSTFLGSRTNKGRAIFEFLLDLGTIYAVVSNLKTGEPEGYVRLFLALNNNNEPSIFIDATDGIPTNANIGPVKEFINDFALKVGVKKENVFDKEWGVINKKIGDALTNRYLQQAGVAISGHLSKSAGSPLTTGDLKKRHGDILASIEKLSWLRDTFSNTMPKEVLSGPQPEQDYKVRRNFFQGLYDELGGIQDNNLISDGSVHNKINSFLKNTTDYFDSLEKPLTSEKNIQDANNIIDEALIALGNELKALPLQKIPTVGSPVLKAQAVNGAPAGLNNEFGEWAPLSASEADKGGIDLSKIELTLKDEKYVSSLNAADVKILRATRALNQGWDSLTLLYIHEIISFVKYSLIKDLTQKAAILELLSQLNQRQELDEEASRFFTILQASQDLREIKLALN